MSRHHIQLMHEGRAVLVVAGYDRPLRELFLQVFRAGPACLDRIFPEISGALRW